MPDDPMWILTDVAPYQDGPAGVHAVLPQAVAALSELADLAGLDPRPVAVADLTPGALAEGGEGGVLALFTIGETRFTDAQRAAIVDRWRAGALGVLAMHSATDACHTWPEYGGLVGARFAGHPWTQDFTIEVADRDHPATAQLGPTWDWHDEVYLFSDLRPDARVLLRLAPGQVDMDAPGAFAPDCGFPLAWCHSGGGEPAGGGGGGRGGGRTFYSALGHFPWAWETPVHLRYLAGGLAWLRDAPY